MIKISTRINGTTRSLHVRPNETLLMHLRDSLQLKGTVEGCGVGVCGACTVLVDGQLMTACLMLAADVDGRDVTTIEGLGSPTALEPVQKAFLEHQAFQCGFCTPGMILAVRALLADRTDRDPAAVRDWLAGNLCRCGTYVEVLEAIASLQTDGADVHERGEEEEA